MIISRIARLSFAAAVATALPIGGAIALTGSPAGASTVTIKCGVLTGTETGTTQLSSCNANGGSTKAAQTSTLLTGGTIKWANGDKTTFGAPTVTSVATPNCVTAGSSEDSVKGAVTKDKDHTVAVPGKYKGDVCIDPSGNLSLAIGTKFKVS